MLLLTSQIFDIRSDAMQESKTSGLYRNPENNQATLVPETNRNSKLNSQSVPSEIHVAANCSKSSIVVKPQVLVASLDKVNDSDGGVSKGTAHSGSIISSQNDGSKLPWINAKARYES